ncbi:pyridoxamine 5'-phosphate oxidase family protein [Thermodesulfobacteriota bacterium]
MDFQDCIKFAKEQRVAYFATEENGQPRVRPLGLWFADEKGFYFQAYNVKAVCKQLQKNNRAEICFYAPGSGGAIGKVMRVAGEVKFIDDIGLKTKVLEDRPFLKNLGIESPEDPRLAIFCLYTGEAFFWTMEYSMRESEIKRIKF